jgi:hypothetical protein
LSPIRADSFTQQTISYTREGLKISDAANPNLCSRQALERVYDVQESVAFARPYSVSLLAYGETFVYSEGVLCCVDGPLVRILDIHNSSKTEDVIDVTAIDQRLAPRPGASLSYPTDQGRITSLRYCDRVLVCVCEDQTLDECWLLVVDLGLPDSKNSSGTRAKRRLPFRHRLSCTTKLFVRHDRSYLYYGTHSGRRSDSHHEWLVSGLDLETGYPIAPKPFQLADFVGSDLGSTACFEIHDGFLFAVSNQTSFEVEEVDWTSYYHCIQIPLGEAKPDLKAYPIWQRQHSEGPINDSWTDISLQKDGQTNELLIVECRKEWLGGGSANIRTYYTQPLRFNGDDKPMEMCNFPKTDPLTRTLDEHSKPHFSEPRKRIRKYFHHEYEQSRLDPRNSPPRDFILAKTSFRAYNPSAMSFIDLVSDPAPIPGSVRMRDRLRLRIASRRQSSPLIEDPAHPGSLLLRKPELDENDDPIEGSEDDFHPTEVYLWPPDDAPAEIYDILCPSGRAGNIEAVADERSIIYMTDAPIPTPGRSRAIVMINFDPTWGHNLKPLVVPSTNGPPLRPPKEMKLQLPSTFPSHSASKRSSPAPDLVVGVASSSSSSAYPSQSKRQKCEPNHPTERGPTGKHERWMWEDRAMYLSINQGYRLRR